EDASKAPCSPISTGSVLLADILPTLFIKLVAPFTLHSVPYGIRHLVVVLCQASSFLIVAYSDNLFLALMGVCFASFGSGLGEISYLSLASNFPRDVISGWSSGTGAAGILGALTYAILTDRAFLAMTPSHALLFMLIVPAVFALTFSHMLQSPPTVHRVVLWRPETYWIPRGGVRRPFDAISPASSTEDLYRPLMAEEALAPSPVREDVDEDSRHRRNSNVHLALSAKIRLIKPLLRFMVPLSVVYFAEYFINQGLVELLVFDCAHGFGLNVASQYRWYQVLYQLGVFVSRSSIRVLTIRASFLPVLSVLQLLNALLFFGDAQHPFIGHIVIVFVLVLYEGLLGGSAYVNTFNAVHQQVPRSSREFSMGFVAVADSLGIVLAGFLAIPAHNYICGARK
ncbi:Protein CLN-3.2, partial [Aphelenchoides avenae]